MCSHISNTTSKSRGKNPFRRLPSSPTLSPGVCLPQEGEFQNCLSREYLRSPLSRGSPENLDESPEACGKWPAGVRLEYKGKAKLAAVWVNSSQVPGEELSQEPLLGVTRVVVDRLKAVAGLGFLYLCLSFCRCLHLAAPLRLPRLVPCGRPLPWLASEQAGQGQVSLQPS